jgi:hypothetical protein
LSKLERRKRAAKRACFPREIGHKSQGRIYVLRLSEFSVVGGRTVRMRTIRTGKGKGTKMEARLGTVFKEFLLLSGRTEQSIQQVVVTIFEVLQFLGGSYNNTDLARKSR